MSYGNEPAKIPDENKRVRSLETEAAVETEGRGGTRIVLDRDHDVCVYDVRSGTIIGPVWSADGSHAAFGPTRDGKLNWHKERNRLEPAR